jgi:cysteine desulfurase/selenocysteine lyase
MRETIAATVQGANAMLDAHVIRKDFPILSREVHGKPLVYLDNAATSQKPRQVLEALDSYYRRYNANVHRGIHTLAEEATAAYEGAREKVARFINAPRREEVVFTRGTTEAINLVRYSWGRANVREGDEILITIMEHHSNFVPWILLSQETGAKLRHLDIGEDGLLRMDRLDDFLNERTRLVAVVHASNVLGTINPIRQIVERAHAVGAKVLVDAAQSAPHVPVDVQEVGCDFLAFSGHKMLGPTGVGVLWGRAELLEAMPPFMGGGEMIREVHLDRATWNDIPWKFEAGTPNIAQVIGLGAAVDYLESIGMESVRAHEIELTSYALRALHQIGAHVYGPKDAKLKGGVAAFTYCLIHPHDLAQVLDSEGVAIRAGHHCAQPLMRRLGVPSTARASFYLYNTQEDVDALVAALEKARHFFGVPAPI